MNEINLDKSEKNDIEKAIDKFSTGMLNAALDGIKQATANKQKEVDYWKRKAYILANKNRLCYQHEIRANEKNFNNSGLSFEDYIKHGIDCMECDAKNIKDLTTEEIIK